jgi:hypothetical protein
MMSDLLAAIAALLVIQFLFLDIVYRETKRYLTRKGSGEHRGFLVLFWARQVPLAGFTTLSWYALLPTTVRSIATMKSNLWDFDPASAVFILIDLGFTAVWMTIAYLMLRTILLKFHKR